jgi:hypothetical protein
MLMFWKKLSGVVSEDWFICVCVRITVDVDALIRLALKRVRKNNVMFSTEENSVIEAPRSKFLCYIMC